MTDHDVTRLDGDYKIGGLLGDEEELYITAHNGGMPFTYLEVADIVGRPVTVNGVYGQWRAIAAVHTEGGWGVKLTLERVPLDEARELAALGLKPLTVKERLDRLDGEISAIRAEIKRVDRRLDATINIAARDAAERIRKGIARAVGNQW